MTLDRVVMKLDKCFDDGMAYGERMPSQRASVATRPDVAAAF